MSKNVDSARDLINTIAALQKDPYSHTAEQLQSVAQQAHDDIEAAGGDYAGTIAAAMRDRT